MRNFKILKWENIKLAFSHKLLLGNGASRAIWDDLKYHSIYQAADKDGRIDENLKDLFSDFNTNDFEYVLRLLRQTNMVNKILRIEDKKTNLLYNNLRQTLIDTIGDNHPKHEQVNTFLIPIAKFMSRFKEVISLNYDLIVYWAMLEWNTIHGNWFKDGFVDGRFDNDFSSYMYDPHEGLNAATIVSYPHGSLILATDLSDAELKLSRSGERYLLQEILSAWETGEYIPLFVSEGISSEKLKAIQRSNYLKTIFDTIVESKTDTLTVFGWSFRDEDMHILKGIVKGGVERLAVSVHTSSGNTNNYCQSVFEKVNNVYQELIEEGTRVKRPSLYFFDSESEGCWTRDNSEKME